MAMDEAQAKAVRIRQELLPGLRGVAKSSGISDEVNLICTRSGSIDLTIQRRSGGQMWPLFHAAEIADDSYKVSFLPRVTKLLQDMR